MGGLLEGLSADDVSILAPRNRGACRRRSCATSPRLAFQSSLPVTGERVLVSGTVKPWPRSFQSSLPVTGERVEIMAELILSDVEFQSSLPVTGERVVRKPISASSMFWFQSSLPVTGERVPACGPLARSR